MTKIFELITELIGWLQIAASPLLIGLLIGSVVYFPNQTKTNLLIGICIALLGLVIGVILATKIFKSKKMEQFGFYQEQWLLPNLTKKTVKIKNSII